MTKIHPPRLAFISIICFWLYLVCLGLIEISLITGHTGYAQVWLIRSFPLLVLAISLYFLNLGRR